MKIIVSHDVDHLYPSDHFFRDLILEKMWVRSFLHLCRGKISFRTFAYRLTLPFRKKMNCIEEVMAFDRANGVPSVFFFGMDRLLGMSYSRKAAAPMIRRVLDNGFDAGVHGVDHRNEEAIREEHDAFAELSGSECFGLRNHYVRFDDQTFEKMDRAGYLYDSTWFNKEKTELRGPYRVGKMWEFPLHIMDTYVCHPGEVEAGILKTQQIIRQAEQQGLPYCTILFHDYQFHDGQDPQMKRWYMETIRFCRENNYEFISYRDAIRELENDT